MLFVFKTCQVIVLLVFVFEISALKKRSGMMPLIHETLTSVLKLVYVVPLALYLYTVLFLKFVHPADLFALFLTLAGTVLVIKARIDLGPCHTWTGYCLKETKLVTHGIYAYIRHPMYVGIFIFVFGGVVTVLFHSSLLFTIATLVFLAYITTFVAVVAKRETKYLANTFGADFLKYKDQVHAFLPIRRFRRNKVAP
jgi:protein-S-isoprenylcysteine O-methyltransferase Ste14